MSLSEANTKVNNRCNALMRSFIFEDTIEGDDYWWDVALSLVDAKKINDNKRL